MTQFNNELYAGFLPEAGDARFAGAIITALGSAIGGGMLALLIQNLVQR